jgi:PPOX class probable F420-dependent enzyme
MSRAEWLAFALQGTRTGKLATVRADGSPHVAPVWFVIDSADRIVFTTGADTVKGKALRRDPRFSLCVDDERPPFSYVVFHARASLSDDAAAKLAWATRIGARYMGPERGEEFGRRNAVPEELLVIGTITSVVAAADIAS